MVIIKEETKIIISKIILLDFFIFLSFKIWSIIFEIITAKKAEKTIRKD
jgi:hypothetical protein